MPDGIGVAIRELQEPEITLESAAAKLKNRWQSLEDWFNSLPQCLPVSASVIELDPIHSIEPMDREGYSVKLDLQQESPRDRWRLWGQVSFSNRASGAKKPVQRLSLQEMYACVSAIELLVENMREKVNSRAKTILAAVEHFDAVVNSLGIPVSADSTEGA